MPDNPPVLTTPPGGPATGKANWLLLALVAVTLVVALVVVLQLEDPPALIDPTESSTREEPQAQPTVAPAATSGTTEGDQADPSTGERTLASATGEPDGDWVIAGIVQRREEPVSGLKLRIEQFAGYEAVGSAKQSTEVTSSETGRFAWATDRPSGTVTVRVSLASKPKPDADFRVRPVEVTVPPGNPTPDSIRVEVTPLEALITGRVTGPTGQPIGGASLRQWSRDPITTAADGTYRMRVVARRSAQLYVRAAGFIQQRVTAKAVEPGKTSTCDVRLQPGLTVRGIVVDEQQRPIPNARVATFYTAFGGWVDAGPDGRFVIDYLEPGRPSHSLFARKSGYVEASANIETDKIQDEYRLVMRRGVRVFGRTLDANGRPVPGTSIYVGFSGSDFSKLTTISNDLGEYEFAAVDSGAKQLVADHDRYATSITKLEIPKEGAGMRVDLRLERGKGLAGKVVDSDGNPVAGVSLSVLEAGDGHRYIGNRTQTDKNGSFSLEGLPSGQVKLEVYGTGWIRLTTDDLDTGQQNLSLTIERSATLAGRVVDAVTGQPIPSFRIRFRSGSGGYSATWVREGRLFESGSGEWTSGTENLQAGVQFTVEATADGYAKGSMTMAASTDPNAAANVMKLHRGQTIDGRVVDRASGLPVSGVRLVLATETDRHRLDRHEDFYDRVTATSKQDGQFTLRDAPAGEVLIALRHPDWAKTMHGPFTVTAGLPLRGLVIQSAKRSTLRLRVVDASGQPVAGLKVGRSAADGSTTGADGIATVQNLDPGPHHFWAQSTGAEPQTVWNHHGTITAGESAEWTMRPGPCELEATLTGKPAGKHGGSAFLTKMSEGQQTTYRLTARESRIHVRGLPAGKFKLWFSNGSVFGSKDVELVAGTPLRIELQVRANRR